ncbi:carbohydrate sulfotransferase 11-like [Orbicella faveolata]|uniref:carbohydrate sulfotransferase 11-like n=1 Tax=Orbicella faveolata TaxID=48498 RepID=UPI0009E311B6|nr:carbohydrate sulfotransferase 11-like [Orbicella faveolata]
MAIRRFGVNRLCSVSAILLISLISMLPLLLIMKTDRGFKNHVTEVSLIIILKDIINMTHVPCKKFQKDISHVLTWSSLGDNILLSAYKDCFWGKFKRSHKGWKYYRKEIRKLLAKHSGLDIDVNVDNTTFEQFATYLVLRWREGGLFQEHWREQYKLCHPCQVQFDYVGHYETLQDDAQFVLRKTKLDDKVFFPEWQPTNTSALMKNYYSTLSLLRIRQLWNIYKKDFELFGYTYPGAIQMVVDNLLNDKV